MRKIVSLCLMLVMSMMIWADRTLYFVPNSNWTQANAKFAVYCFENEESEWSNFMTLVTGETNVYTTTIPDSYTQVIFCRMNSAATECNWGSKWNQSADITLPTDGKDMFTLADGWDQISGTWSNYAAPQQQDTTNVSPLANKHFYLNGEFLNWDTQKALEFTLADSLFTLTVDTLSGIFKVMTARNWEAPDYGGDYNVNLTLGVPYTLTERGYDLSCSTIYLNAELQLRLVGNDVILTLVSGTPVQQDTTGTPEPVATPHFYLTGNEAFVGAGKAAWNKEDGYVSYGDTLTLNLGAGTYEVQLINANDEWKGYDALSQPIAENITTNSWGNICFYMAQAGQVTFIYKTDNTFLIQGTFAKPRYHFYYIGTAVNWIVNDALEFEYQDSVYTLSLATLEGEFKIMTARDWSELSFGRNSSTEYITPGVPYEMTAWTDANIVVNGTLSNVTLQLTYVNQVATITVIENNPGGGGEQPQDTTIVPPVVDEVTVYTVMPEGWAALNAYVWPDQGTNYVAWPGEAMTPTGLVFRNAAVYSYTFPANYTHIIFNNGEGGQTANMDVNPATPYFYKGEWYASWDEVPEVEPQPQPAEAHYYLVGGFNSWNQNTAIEFSRQDSVYTVTIDTLFGSMKVLVSRETWEGNYGVPSQDDAALTLGEPKALVAYIDGVSYSYDFNVEGTILNAVLNFVVTENGATITLVSGTPYVAPIEDTHYYFIGSVNSWNFETAPEFTYADSIYTLSLDSLYGNFKVTGAHDWNHGNYGAHTSGDVLLLGGEYQMASANSQDLWVDGTYTNVVLALTNTNNILTIHFVQGTLVQDTVAPQPQPENYYIKNNWNGGEWAWRQMEEVVGMSDDTIVTFWGYTDVFGGVGVNISTAGDNTEPDTWYAINDFIIADGDLVPQAMDSVSFIYDAVNHLVYAFVINRPGVDPLNPDTIVPQPEKHYYLVGQFNGWDVTTAPEFTNADSLFTITIDTLSGEFKVMTARDWGETNYGAVSNSDQLTIGEAYTLVVSGNNFTQTTVYLNAVLEIREVGEAVMLTLVSGTPYQQPIEDRHFYLVGSFNDWTVTEAPEFTLQDSIYTITIDTMAGEFKVVDARDWLHNIYGAYYYGEVLTPGNEYAMAAMNSENFSLITTYTNVTFNLRVENNVVTIIFVSGTQMPTTGLDTAVGNTAAPVKLIENGALIILRDGVKYNAAGQRIR